LAVGSLPDQAFVIAAAARTAGEHVIYNPHNGALIYDANGSAAGGAVQFAKLAAGLALHASDFLVV
jgi:Ca2+-binding RTX toxin-like protein